MKVGRHLDRCKLAANIVKAYGRQCASYVAWLTSHGEHPDAFVDVVGAEAAVTAWRRHPLRRRLGPATVNQALAAVTLMYEHGAGLRIQVKRTRVPAPGEPIARLYLTQDSLSDIIVNCAGLTPQRGAGVIAGQRSEVILGVSCRPRRSGRASAFWAEAGIDHAENPRRRSLSGWRTAQARMMTRSRWVPVFGAVAVDCYGYLDHVNSHTDLPGCCAHRGLNFDDGAQRACPRHMTPEQAGLVAELHHRARGVLTAPDHWPYGPNVDGEARRRMLDWADQYNLRHVDPSHLCPRRVELGYCRKGWQCPDRVDGRGWSDHPTMWADQDRNKTVVIVAQPYGLSDYDRAEAQAVADRHSLLTEFRELGSWYGHGTSFVGLWAAGHGPYERMNGS